MTATASNGGADDGLAIAPVPGMTVASGPSQEPGQSFFDAVGGHPTFTRIVRSFYAGVAADPILGPMYPAHDLDGAAERLTLFLEQYWGGPTTYSEERGHPRLRMRHAPYPVDDTARQHWLANMRLALDAAMAEHGLNPLLEKELWGYLVGAAQAMVNSPGPGPDGVLPTIGDPA